MSWRNVPVSWTMACRSAFVALMLLVSIDPCTGADEPSPIAAEETFFREKVEPILRRRCYDCHSHASGVMESGLTLDWQSGWAKGGERGPAIVPGNVEASLLIRAIQHVDPALRMPEEKLPDDEIAVLVRWVANNAVDPRRAPPQDATKKLEPWWSLQPLVKPPVPAGSVSHPIDAFIQARSATKQLTPSPPADRRTWIRRLTFDLHGLPPSLEEVSTFVSDDHPQADATLVERLLASPRYGERWARHWLDTIHFADSHGFEHDVFRPNAWRYRDYVIDSFNRDTPWPRFIREQLAADAFFPEAKALTVALGFLGAGSYDHSAAITAPKSFEYLDRDDLVTQTMSAFVSVTAHCARCHTHKFDPIAQKDYFALQAVFAGIGKGEIPFDADPDVGERRAHWQQLKNAAEQLDTQILMLPEHQAFVGQWEEQHAGSSQWVKIDPEVFLSSETSVLQKQVDGSVLASGSRPDKETVTVTATTPLPTITALRLDLLTDPSLPLQGPGRMDNGNLHLSEFELRVFRPSFAEGESIPFRRATADFDQSGWTIQHAIDNNPSTAWGIHPQEGKPHHAIFELAVPLTMEPGSKLVISMKQLHGRGHLIGRWQLSATGAAPTAMIALSAEAEVSLSVPPDQRTETQRTRLAAAVLAQRASAELQQLPAMDKVYAASAQATNERGLVQFDKPRAIHLLKRGDVEKPLEEVGPGALSAVGPMVGHFDLPAQHAESTRRAALAEWIVDPQNPLTWRSIANRVWQYHFGRGICDTPSDFGRMGGTPTHPELLDWLACELRDNGGSIKHLQRLICTSSTYRQASTERADIVQHDPENRLLARMSRSRLDADAYRDAVLAATGCLDLTSGGPGIQHFSQSPGPQLTPILDYQKFDWNSPGATRRSIYRVVWRGIPDPLMESLDFPDLGQLTPTRGFSSSPLQTLVLLNNRFVLHHAERMAEGTLKTKTTGPEQVQDMARRIWLREPTSTETDQLTALAQKHGLAAVCRLLLNSSEFLFVD